MIPPHITEVLDQLNGLLMRYGEADWARACRQHRAAYIENEAAALRAILAMYGGMGSFNDIVLYSDSGQVAAVDNDEFDRLRSALHALCYNKL
jgi:hypothetical protein